MSETYLAKYDTCCCGFPTTNEFKKDIRNSLIALELTNQQKESIVDRYIQLVLRYQTRTRFINTIFYVIKIFVLLGTIICPFLISFQSDQHTSYYWAVYILSLISSTLVALLNGLDRAFLIDNKYYRINKTLEELKSEGWAYFQLCGKYLNGTHQSMYALFCDTVENIHRTEIKANYTSQSKSNISSPILNTSQQLSNSAPTDSTPPNMTIE